LHHVSNSSWNTLKPATAKAWRVFLLSQFVPNTQVSSFDISPETGAD